LHTVAMRRSLSHRHETCAAEGCERPFAWCDIHHPHAWSAGGVTSVDNGLPLCGHHHRRAHDRAYTMRTLPSGEVRFRRRP
ncbi:MAG: HNH endonuclease signature motif containing protein, partial [Nocardioidaceae bacterium]